MGVKNLAFSRLKFPSIGVFLILMLPFSYFEVQGARPIVLGPVIFIYLVVMLKKYRVNVTMDMTLYLFFIFYVFALSFVSRSNISVSLVIFLVYSLWPVFLSKSELNEDLQFRLIKAYIFSALFCSIGVISQRFIFEFLGLEVGKIDRYGGGRIGFGFVWLDYSYLSLFLVSAVPLLYAIKLSSFWRYSGVLILVIGSLITTARTGIVAMIVILWAYSVYVFLSRLLVNKINIGSVSIVSGSVVIAIFGYFYLLEFSSRDFVASGSGRLEGYLKSLEFVSQNPYFGAMFAPDLYKLTTGVIPHNLFLYITSMGGVFVLLLFLAWLVLFGISALNNSPPIKVALLVVFFGLQFVPSVFSAYFIGGLVSISLFERLRKKYAEY